jgi:hypothetical protein
MRCFALIVCPLLALTPAPAQAYCEYRGIMNARTTLAQEFRDSRWVVRVRVLSAIDHWSDIDQSWTLYRLEVLRRYKGSPPRRILFFTERNTVADSTWTAPGPGTILAASICCSSRLPDIGAVRRKRGAR